MCVVEINSSWMVKDVFYQLQNCVGREEETDEIKTIYVQWKEKQYTFTQKQLLLLL